MGRLTLRQRRLLSRGIGPRDARHWGPNVPFLSLGVGNRSTAAFGTGNAAFVVYSRKPGTQGNSTSFRVVTGAGSNSVTTTGDFSTSNAAVVANVVTGTTVDQLARLVNGDATARPQVHVQRAAGSDGTAAVAAAGPTTLTGAV